MLTLPQLQVIMPRLPSEKAAEYLPHLNAAMAEFHIDSPERIAAFLAQLAHESGELTEWEELPHTKPVEGCGLCEALLPGSSAGRELARRHPERFPGHVAGAQYEGRDKLGNTEPGDGVRFKGRGPIGLVGRDAYRRVSEALFPQAWACLCCHAGFEVTPSTTHPRCGCGQDMVRLLEAAPHQVLLSSIGFRVAGWMWATAKNIHGPLNELADIVDVHSVRGTLDTARRWFDYITRVINGGLKGADKRWGYYLRAREVLGVAP